MGLANPLAESRVLSPRQRMELGASEVTVTLPRAERVMLLVAGQRESVVVVRVM